MDANIRKYIAEGFGTMILVLIGCGCGAIAGYLTGDYLLIAFAFGLGLMVAAFTIGPISGCHINPAVSIGVFLAGRMEKKDLVGYIIGQFIGAIIGALILYAILSSCTLHVSFSDGLCCNGYGDFSYTGIAVWGALLTEIILTMLFVLFILKVTEGEGSKYAGLLIGLALTAIHFVGIPLLEPPSTPPDPWAQH